MTAFQVNSKTFDNRIYVIELTTVNRSRISWLKMSHASNEKSLLSESSPNAPTACLKNNFFAF